VVSATFALPALLSIRVARWFIFKPKIPILGSCYGRYWYIIFPFGQISGYLVYFMALWYILWSFGIFSPFWYIVERKIWQPCFQFPTATCKIAGKKS
jgi:hypothetical protein